VLQPRAHLASTSVLTERCHKSGEIITHVHGHFGLREHAPDRAWKVLVPNLGNPAPLGIVHRQRESRSENRVGFFEKPASGEINAAEIRSSEPAAGAEQCFHRGAKISRVGAFKTLYDFGTKSR
jgi:hypothetical protein